jgi:hypothetical protein
LLRKLNEVCSDPSPDGYRRHEVRYEKASLGRTYARGDVVDVTTLDDADTPELKSMQRSASYQGMFSELRPLLAPCLRDIDMVKAFATIITNLARRNGCTALVPNILQYASDGNAWLSRIAAHHDLEASMGADVAKSTAKELVNSTLNFGSYKAWQEKHGRDRDAQMPDVWWRCVARSIAYADASSTTPQRCARSARSATR